MIRRYTVLLAFFCLLVAGIPALAQEIDLGRAALNGSWLVTERGENIEAILVVDEGSIVTTEPAAVTAEQMPIQYVPDLSSIGHHILQIEDSGRRAYLHWLLQSPDRGIIWMEGDDDLVVTRRIGPMPESLLGSWLVGHPEGDSPEATSVTFHSETLTMANIDRTRTMRAYAMVTDGTVFEVVGVDASGQEEWWVFQPIPEGGFIVWENGDDDYLVFYRTGQQPAWLSVKPQ